MAKWLVIAENEIMLMTSRFHGHRKILFGIIIAVIMAYIASIYMLLVPLLASEYVIDFLRTNTELIYFFLSFSLLYGFTISILVPISGTLREANVVPLEIILSSPTKPQDVFFGTFVSKALFYAIGTFILLLPFDVVFIMVFNMDIIGFLIFNVLTILLIVTGVWISTLAIGLVMSRLARTSRGQDIAKALNVVLAIILFVIMYSAGLFNPSEMFLNPYSMEWSTYLPSGFAVSLILALVLDIPAQISVEYAAIGFFGFVFASFIAGYKLSGRFFNLEPVEATTVTIRREAKIYDIVRKIVPGTLGETTVLHLKDFARRMESMSKFIYGFVLSIILMYALLSGLREIGEVLQWILMFIIPYTLSLVVLLLGSDIMIRGKDTLWIFRRIPKGIKKFVFGKYIQVYILELPIALIIPIALMFMVPGIQIDFVVQLTVVCIIALAGYTAEIIGIFCINPAFHEKSAKFGINILIFMLLAMGLPPFTVFLLPLTFLITISYEMFFQVFSLLLILISVGIGTILMVLGIARLENIE